VTDTAPLHPADQTAFDRLIQAIPVWEGIDTAADALGLDANVLLHAGPPFASPMTISMPILNSACVAAVFEGLAQDFDQAEAMIKAGEILLQPAQDHSTVTPLAAVVSASMPMHRVVDLSATSNRIYAPINGGSRPAMRLGLRSLEVLGHIRWLNGPFAELLQSGLSQSGLTQPMEIVPMAAVALRAGDDCHGRTPAGSKLLMDTIARAIPGGITDAGTREFIDSSPSLFLNLWMAVSKCLMMRASGVADSSFVTAVAGNGVDTGIQISALPGRWFQAPATAPNGRFDIDLPADRALPAIGDSAVVEALGLGAMSIHLSPLQEKNFGDFLPDDYRSRGARLMCGKHPGFGDLDCRFGLTARAAAEQQQGPIIGLGMLDITGEKGRLGGGVYDMPVTVFADAMAALEAG
jgi:hypothetical protein